MGGPGDLGNGQELWRSREVALFRDRDPALGPVLRLEPLTDHPNAELRERMRGALDLAPLLEAAWVTRPLALRDIDGRACLFLQDPGGLLLADVLARRRKTLNIQETVNRLRLAMTLTTALARFHATGLVHRNINPSAVLVAPDGKQAWLTGLTLASRVSRHRQVVAAKTAIGSLPYASPEQTGRMNRSVDMRSDLYSLGVIFFQLFTGQLPFSAQDPLGWVHCHVARQPLRPMDVAPSLPNAISGIILKLLSKSAEDRYQSASGLAADLTWCLKALDSNGLIPPFPLGDHDNPGHLVVPETLYGREDALTVLTTTLERVQNTKTVELVLVGGYAGVGKSSLISQFQATALDRGTTFGVGKFDQHKRDIPYATFAQAFDALVRQLLSEDDETVSRARQAIREAVGQNGRLLTDLIPILETLIGPQPSVPDLPVTEARIRFETAFGQFVQVFAAPDCPLILALDDLQWIDSGSLRMLEYLCTHPDQSHVLIIGSYRSNEVLPSHSFVLALKGIEHAGTPVSTVDLRPLDRVDLARMVADCLRTCPERVGPLVDVVGDKTGGNPFFVIQFLENLVDEGLLSVVPGASEWQWDPNKIRAKGFTDNVVDLMAARLGRLPEAVQAELRNIACLGNTVDVATLARVQGRTESEVLAAVTEALETELIYHDNGCLAFLHDRVREAAYLSLREPERVEAHLRIGRILADTLPPERLESQIFDVVHHLNQAQDQIRDDALRTRLSHLNTIAGRRARASTDHASALVYFRLARDLLTEEAWRTQPDQTFDVYLELAESEYLAGNHKDAEVFFRQLLTVASTPGQSARVWRLRFRVFMVAGKVVDAVNIALNGLAQFGLTCPEDPDDMETALVREQACLRAILDTEGRDVLFRQTECDEPRVRTLLELIADAIPVVYHIRAPLYPYLALMGIRLSLEHGATAASSAAFSAYAVWLMDSFEDIPAAVSFSEAALRFAQRSDAGPLLGATQCRHGYFIANWRTSLGECLRILDESFRACLETGNLVYAASMACISGWYCFEQGLPLTVYDERLNQFASFLDSTRIPWAIATQRLQECFLAALRDEDVAIVQGNVGGGTEAEAAAALQATGHGHGVAVYHVMKQIPPFLLGRFEESLERADMTDAMVVKLSAALVRFSHVFFAAMAIACVGDGVSAERWARLAPRFKRYREQLKMWADNCPENFESHHLLVEAEAARMDGKGMDSLALYERAIAAARARGRLHVEGIACERAGGHARGLGLETAARAYLRDARYAFDRWGAVAKVRLLDRTYPWLPATSRETDGARDQLGLRDLDLAAVIKAQQAVSGQIVLPKLVEALLRIVLEHAGADRGLLLMRHADSFRVAAEAWVGDAPGDEAERGDVGIHVTSTVSAVRDDILAMPVFHYVARTRDRLLITNAAASGTVGTEAYAARTGAKSIVCQPVMTRGEMTAILYLENHLATDAFTQNRVAVLDMLVSQASISLENATLYAEMEERVRERTKDLVQSLDMVRAKGEQVSILLDNSDQGFLSCDRDLIVAVEYSRACEDMLDTMPAGQPIDQLLWSDIPVSADLVRDVIPTVLDGIDPLRAEMMIGLLPKEIRRGDKVLEAQYKVLENRQMMVVLTDVTAERRLRERLAEERRHLEMIVAAVTDGHEFFDTVAAVRLFAADGLDRILTRAASPEEVLQNLYREVHTLKGLLNQFSFSATPTALHTFEDHLTQFRNGSRPLTFEALAAAARAVPYVDLLDRDLTVVRQVLGEDFLTIGKRVMLTWAQVRRLKRLAADLLAGRAIEVTSREIRSFLLEVGALGQASIKRTLAAYAPLVQRIAEREEKEIAPLEVLGEDVMVEPDRFRPFLRSLGHVFRNAVIHGIESPDERVLCAKNEAGKVTCVVSTEGQTIRIEIADDGGGINPDALKRRAEFLFGSRKVQALSHQEVMHLLFLDGLSTQDVANDFSGRGVGMAAVRQAVLALDGTIQIESELGHGTRFIFTVQNPTDGGSAHDGTHHASENHHGVSAPRDTQGPARQHGD